MIENSLPAPVADSKRLEWIEHPRLPGIFIKPLLGAADNPLANVNLVRVPPGAVIGWHDHKNEIETVYVLAGESVLSLENTELDFNTGQIVAIPAGLQHALRNTGSTDVDLVTFFTPPIG